MYCVTAEAEIVFPTHVVFRVTDPSTPFNGRRFIVNMTEALEGIVPGEVLNVDTLGRPVFEKRLLRSSTDVQ